VATGVTMDLLGKPAIFLTGLGALLFVLIVWAVIRAHAFLNRASAEPAAQTAVAERDAA